MKAPSLFQCDGCMDVGIFPGKFYDFFCDCQFGKYLQEGGATAPPNVSIEKATAFEEKLLRSPINSLELRPVPPYIPSDIDSGEGGVGEG